MEIDAAVHLPIYRFLCLLDAAVVRKRRWWAPSSGAPRRLAPTGGGGGGGDGRPPPPRRASPAARARGRLVETAVPATERTGYCTRHLPAASSRWLGFEGNVCPGQVTSTTQVLLIMYLHKIVICGAFCRLGTAVDRARAGSGSVRLSPRAVPGGRAAAVPVAARGGLLLTGQRVPAAHARLSNLRRR
jgi:hypothetical protein